MNSTSFRYRILFVEDEPIQRDMGELLLSGQGYEILCVEDGLRGLAALRHSLPDIIISDLHMPRMNGFEFLSVVRRRFPTIPVIAISGEFNALSMPENVLADAYFSKGAYHPADLFRKISELLHELPPRPRIGKSCKATVWVRSDKQAMAVTCPECLRTFSMAGSLETVNEMECEFCSCRIRVAIIADGNLARRAG